MFGFATRGKLNLSWWQDNSIGIVPLNQWTWGFDKQTNIVAFYDGNKKTPAFSFRPVSERKIEIQSHFAEHKGLLTTTELTVVRIK